VTEQVSNRRDLIRLGGAMTLAVVAGGSGLMAASAADSDERKILGFALTLERLQVSLYSAAEQRPYLTGELAEYVRVVSGHERAHVALLENLLGPAAPPKPHLDLTAALADADAFMKAAAAVEDVGVAAYDGQMPRLSRAGLAATSEIVSVEARHAAWIRDLAGLVPAPQAADSPLAPSAVRTRLQAAGIHIEEAS